MKTENSLRRAERALWRALKAGRQRTEFTSLTCVMFFCMLFLFVRSPLLFSEETPSGTQAIKVGDEAVLMKADGSGGGRRGKAAVAFGKDNYLVAWQEGWHSRPAFGLYCLE